MPTAGLIGGIAPASTVDYYQRIIAAWRARCGDGTYPNIVINSIDLTKLLRLVGDGRLDELTEFLLIELERLRAAGADFALLCSNTPHLVFDRLLPRTPLPLVSIVEAACAAASRDGYTCVGLLGTRFTMAASFYPSAFAAAGIRVVVPTEAEQADVHRRYMEELVGAQFLPATRTRFLEVIDRMRTRDAIQAMLLAGTELPLLLRDAVSVGQGLSPAVAACPFLDTTAIHVDAAVDRLLACGAGLQPC